MLGNSAHPDLSRFLSSKGSYHLSYLLATQIDRRSYNSSEYHWSSVNVWIRCSWYRICRYYQTKFPTRYIFYIRCDFCEVVLCLIWLYKALVVHASILGLQGSHRRRSTNTASRSPKLSSRCHTDLFPSSEKRGSHFKELLRAQRKAIVTLLKKEL